MYLCYSKAEITPFQVDNHKVYSADSSHLTDCTADGTCTLYHSYYFLCDISLSILDQEWFMWQNHTTVMPKLRLNVPKGKCRIQIFFTKSNLSTQTQGYYDEFFIWLIITYLEAMLNGKRFSVQIHTERINVFSTGSRWYPWPLFTKKMPSYGKRNLHYKPKLWWPSQVYNGDPDTNRTVSSQWIGALRGRCCLRHITFQYGVLGELQAGLRCLWWQ